jgi:hypothetical protein
MDSSHTDISNKLINFVGDLPVKTLHELLNVESTGVSVVPVWFDSVVDGVDVWFCDDQCKPAQVFFYMLCSFFVYVFVNITNN